MALKLQQEEIENASNLAQNDETCSVVDDDDDGKLQLQADAAAALLHLKARK